MGKQTFRTGSIDTTSPDFRNVQATPWIKSTGQETFTILQRARSFVTANTQFCHSTALNYIRKHFAKKNRRLNYHYECINIFDAIASGGVICVDVLSSLQRPNSGVCFKCCFLFDDLFSVLPTCFPSAPLVVLKDVAKHEGHLKRQRFEKPLSPKTCRFHRTHSTKA